MSSTRNYRACMVCSILQPGQKFQREGCPNCESFLEMRGSQDTVLDCTSQVWEGIVTLSNRPDSWVARWQRLEGYEPGMYAIKVVGVLPEEYIAAAENAGVKYIRRDGSDPSADD